MTRKVHNDINPQTWGVSGRQAVELDRLRSMLDEVRAPRQTQNGAELDTAQRVEALLAELDDEYAESLATLAAGRPPAASFRAPLAVRLANRCVEETAKLLCDFGPEQAETVGWLSEAAYHLVRVAAVAGDSLKWTSQRDSETVQDRSDER